MIESKEACYADIRQSMSLFFKIKTTIINRFKKWELEKVEDAFQLAMEKYEKRCMARNSWDQAYPDTLAYLYTTTRNNLIDEIKNEKKRKEAEKIFVSFGSNSIPMDKNKFRGKVAEAFIDRYVEEFTPQKARILKAFIKGSSDLTIALKYNIKLETVKTYRSRYRQDLEDFLKQATAQL